MSARASYLLVIGEREALAWVLRESRMAFPATRRPEVDRLGVGDELFLLTTRGCFHNPARDRTRMIGRAVVTTPVVPLHPPLELVGRTFPRGCGLEMASLAPYLTGVDLADLVPRLDAFPDKTAWSIRLRRPLVALSGRDPALVRQRLDRVARPVDTTRAEYLDRIRPVARPEASA
jgi:hypothetical protein